MSASKSYFDYGDEDTGGKLSRKAKESPFMLIGLAGFAAAVAIGAYKFRHRGKMSTSVFLMQLRVAAQGTVVGALSIGLGYSMFNEYILKNKPQEGQE